MISLRHFRVVLSSNGSGIFTSRCNSQVQNISGNIFSNFMKQKDVSMQSVLRPRRGFRSKSDNNEKPTRHKSLAPIEEVSGTAAGFRSLFKPLLFGITVSGFSFAGAAIWQYESMRRIAVTQIHQHYSSSTDSFYHKAGEFRRKLNAWWNSLSNGHKVAAAIISLNTVVFLLWRTPHLSPVMIKYFTSTPVSGSGSVCWSMLLSAFSHYSVVHLFANMYVLWSFSPVISNMFGNEQFVATYITAAMVSGFTSYVYKVARRSMVPSLGASGAIMALIGALCITMPQARLSVAFVDQIFPHSFSADSAMKCLIAFDTIGVLLGWRFFDHAAHLGGILFGIWYVKYGHKMIWKKREPLMRRWHALRGKP